jgi:RimJ/RimL family protein N-acetyltransferase
MAKGKTHDNGHHSSEGQYPRTLVLPSGQAVILRLMVPGDQAAVLAFARSLPSDDLLFLRTDITEKGALEEWTRNVEKGSTVSVIAEIEGALVGYASLHNDQARWTRRVGEIRVLLGPIHRGAGLGRRLAEEIFNLGRARGIKKMAAMMTPDQTGARAAFEKLGFQVEALLQDWVVDRNGRPRDLLIMSHDVEGLSDHVGA